MFYCYKFLRFCFLYTMITLSEEQRRKIEENKAAAEFKKQQFTEKQENTSAFHNLNGTENNAKKKYFRNNFTKSPAKVKFQFKNLISPIKAVCKVFGEDRFLLDMPYHGPSIEMFKTINGRKYEVDLKKWSFPLTEQSALVSKFKSSLSDIIVYPIPDSIINILLEPEQHDSDFVSWSKIDKTLRDYLMPFQADGVKFGVLKKGRCLIADDMGLGKTIQALGIAHYFQENWPLLIVCPSSMKFQWLDAIKTFLPSVEVNIQVLTSGKIQTTEGDIVISSYDLMKNCFEDLAKMKFQIIIFDESHFLKSIRSLRTKAALELANTAKNVILLSGTPALSRPQELYPQIYIIDPFTFKSFFEFGIRYCNGRKDKFGWNFSGSSNLEELEIYLTKKIMIRRLKSEIIKQLPSKMRKVVILHPQIVKGISKRIKKLELEYTNQKGTEQQSALLSYYALSCEAKLNAVCEYIEDKLENENKFLVFAYHLKMINKICELLDKHRVDYIKIDGSVSSEQRKSLCDKFQCEDSCRVAVLSIKAANCGLTFTAAHLVLFAELYWNPGDLTQAEDRAHRIGQQDSVLVEYLIAKGTADDYIWKLIDLKLNTLNKVGLSKDSFKNTDSEQVNDLNQPKLTSFLPSSSRHLEESEVNFSDFSMTKTEDDDIFNSINLEEIENEYQLSNKKRKTSSES